MSFFKDDKDKDNFFSPVSFSSASDSTSSWAFDSGNKKSESSFFDSGSNKGGFDAFSSASSSAASNNSAFSSASNESKSSGNFFSAPSETKNSAFGSMGYNSHSKDQDVFSLKQQLENDSRFGHWTPQDSFIEAENARNNLEDKDWNERFGGSSWAFEKSKEDTKWAYSNSEKSESEWSMKIPSTNSSNWAYSTSSDSSSNWAFNQPSLNRWGFDGNQKEGAADDFDLFGKKKS